MLTKQFDDVLQTFSYARVPKAAMPKLTTQETHLLDQLADLNEARLAMGYGRLPSGVDADTLQAVKRVQQVGISMHTADAIARPFPIPSRVAYEIVMALRGQRVRTPDDNGLPVPSR
jgi:response regulator of citrate/malate metabolism